MLILDGGLATELEARGHDLDDNLWSARILLEAPEAIRQVHLDYLAAGADCIITSTYQASLPGFLSRGLDEVQAIEILRRSVALAIDARDTFWNQPTQRLGRVKPLVAASIGPYGAYLADGSEYTGRYEIDDDGLYEFHQSRWVVLSNTQADLLACETIPSAREAAVLLRLLAETRGAWAWMAFSCRDGAELSDGTAIEEVVLACEAEPRVAAVGVNCTPPQFVASLVERIRANTTKPIIVYPNSGERYDTAHRKWVPAPRGFDLPSSAADWVRQGAGCVGGCCRVGPRQIAAMRHALLTT